MVAIGRLRHRVILEEPVTELDSDGAQVPTWIPFGDGRALPAEISPLSARELIAAEAVHSKVTTRIRLRYRTGITASMRVRHRDMVYEIEGVIPDPDSGRRFVTLLTTSLMSPLSPSAPAQPLDAS